MKPSEFRAKLAEIISVREDQGKVSTILNELGDEFEGTVNQQTLAESTADNLKKDNESLRQANMSLFLKVGQKQEETKQSSEKQVEILPDYADFFDDKGNIKK